MSNFPDEFEDPVAGGVRLLLVGIGGDDAGVLVAAEGDDSLVLGDRAVIDVRRMGRKKQRGLFHLRRLPDGIEALDGRLNLRGEREVIDRGGQNKDFRLRQERERRWAEAEERARQEEEELRDVLRSFGCKVD